MLSENKVESLSALAEILILISDPKIIEYHQISEEVNPFLSSLHFLLKDLNKESVSLVSEFINNIDNTEVDIIDYKTKYQETLVALTDAQKQLLEKRK